MKIKTIRQIKPRIWEMKGGKYTDPRQDLGRGNNSHTRYPRKCFTKIYRALYGDAMLELIRTKLRHGGRKPTETSVTEFCHKSVNLPLEELINIKLILFLILEQRIAKFPGKSHFFNLNDSSLGRHVNAASRKSLEIQEYSFTKPRTLLKRKFV